jgi:cbb3-type cytochrome oxidase maturation protein
MEILIILIPLALALGGFFLYAFVWAAKQGQFDDLETPKHRLLIEDYKDKKEIKE